ncbi:MAG: general secretion pathway protein GspB [Phycisphaerales bacterium]|nr:general secretion pathway protein GspB [Phycisphaerales bacterium]MCI0630718.1 general secretion pathway protein GspB [Phycisphaerales bacterium]MCI0677318.1 general secretion pathway protein GspB [Phycisphaerales bacterium]
MKMMLRRLWIQISADRRRFAALCVMVIVGLLLWARLIVVSHPPRTAIATEPAGASSQTNLDRAGSAHSQNAGVSSAAARSPSRSGVPIQLSAVPLSDPFVISPQYFPKSNPDSTNTIDVPKLPEKSVEDLARLAYDRTTAQIRSMATQFKLEAAVGGSMAVINGKKYRVGEAMLGKEGDQFQFKLVEIRQRSVILECQNRQIELQMAPPGT